MASIMAMVCSATATAFAPGVFITAMPCRVAASRSMLSTPTPARPITRSLRAFASSGPSTCTAERTIKASADSSCPDSVPSICSGVTTVHRGSRSKSTADGEIFSATTTFILNSPFTPSQLCSTHKFIGWMTYSEPLQENDSPLTCLNFSLPRFLSPYEQHFPLGMHREHKNGIPRLADRLCDRMLRLKIQPYDRHRRSHYPSLWSPAVCRQVGRHLP